MASVSQLSAALRKGAQPDQVALEQCVCGLAEAACICLGYSPLHCACQGGITGVVRAMLVATTNPDPRSGRVLFSLPSAFPSQHSADLIETDGLTPLHIAAACGHRRIVEVLLEFHADPHMGGAEPRKTPLGFAVAARQQEVAELLRRAAVERVLERAATMPVQMEGPEAFLASQGGSLHAGVVRDARLTGPENPRIEAIRKRLRAREEEARAAASAPGGQRSRAASVGLRDAAVSAPAV